MTRSSQEILNYDDWKQISVGIGLVFVSGEVTDIFYTLVHLRLISVSP